MSLVARKPAFGVSDEVRHIPGCTATEDDLKLEIWDLGSRGKVLANTKALISFAVSAKLIWVFVFAYAKSRFSHNEAHNQLLHILFFQGRILVLIVPVPGHCISFTFL